MLDRSERVACEMKSNSGKALSVLLASAASSGTIAAVRYLGSMGIDVGVISSGHLCAAVWSRRAARTYSCPSESESSRFLDELLAIGEADPGQILLATSDETAWLYTMHASLLEPRFCLYQPSVASMQRILDKTLLADLATSIGLAVLPSWDPRNIDDVVAIAPTLPYPILIKPRTHVHRLRNDKGIVVRSKSELEFGNISSLSLVSRNAPPVIRFCQTPAYPSCSNLWTRRNMASSPSRASLIGRESYS